MIRKRDAAVSQVPNWGDDVPIASRRHLTQPQVSAWKDISLLLNPLLLHTSTNQKEAGCEKVRICRIRSQKVEEAGPSTSRKRR